MLTLATERECNSANSNVVNTGLLEQHLIKRCPQRKSYLFGTVSNMQEIFSNEDQDNKYETNAAVEQEYKLIEKAYEEFSSGQYDRCLDTLNELEKCSGTNNKLEHNRAVARFYRSGCKDHATLLKTLSGNIDKTSLAGTSSPTHSKAVGTLYSPIARFNMSVIYYHRHMYQTAIETLLPLVNQLKELDEHISFLVSTFMLRLLLVTNQLRRAAAFLEMLQLPEHKSCLSLNRDTLIDEDSYSCDMTIATNHENYYCAYKFLAIQTCILNRKPILVAEEGLPHFAALKAHQYYIMKDFQMAAKQLKKLSKHSEISDESTAKMINACVANNMGIIHLRVRHYAIAAKFFQEAISFDKHVAAHLRDISLYQMSTTRACEILYNMGIAMLHLRRPKEAYKCFSVPLKTHHSNPRLWFRISEACIMEHEMKMLEEDKKPMITSMVHTAGRKIYFFKPTKGNVVYSFDESGPNLHFAALALRNALTLATYYKNAYNVTEDDETPTGREKADWRNVKDNNFCCPSGPVSKKSLDNMLCAIYAAYSYVSLRLGDCVCAYEMAQELLKAEQLSDAHRLLAQMYAGEALLMMDKIDDARPLFEPTFVSSLNAFDFETKDWRVKSLDAAQNVVRYNLAVVTAMQGDIEMCKTYLNSCTHPIVAGKVLSLKTYIDLRMSKNQPQS